jgi:hypothetical protein
MPQICDMGLTALLPFRRKAFWGFFRPKKSDGFGRERTRDLGYQRPACNARSSSMIFWHIPNFTPTCFSSSLPSSEGRISSEATQAISVLWLVYGLQFVQCGHTGQIVIDIQPQHRYCLSSFWDNTTPWWWQWITETCWGKIWNVSISHTITSAHLLVTSKRH